MIGSLSEDQRQRLAFLFATYDTLPHDVDVWDVIRFAHWVWCAQELEVAGYSPVISGEKAHLSPDAARWHPGRLD